MATSDFMGSIPPELLARVLRTGQLGADEDVLRQRMARGQALQQQGTPRYSTPWAAALGGLAGALRTGVGAYEEIQAQKGLESLGQERTAGRQAFVSGVDAAEQQGKQQEAGALLSQRPFVPFATDYNAESLKMRDATAEAGTQQRQQDARSLAVLSGDPVLKQWAEMQASGASEDPDIQRQRLQQASQRLTLAQEAEKRKAGMLERTLGLRERQIQAQREAREAAAAARAAAEEAKKTEKGFDRETGFRKELNLLPEVKDFAEIDNAYNTLRDAARDPSGAAGVTTIFSFMKMIDPGVAVMEGDVDRIRAAGGPAAKWANLYQQALSGNPLPEAVRADLVKQGAAIHRIRKQARDARVEQYRALAKRAGVDPDAVAPMRPSPSAPSAPAVAAPQTPAAASGDVRIRLPDGSEKLIPADKVEEATRDFGAVVL